MDWCSIVWTCILRQGNLSYLRSLVLVAEARSHRTVSISEQPWLAENRSKEGSFGAIGLVSQSLNLSCPGLDRWSPSCSWTLFDSPEKEACSAVRKPRLWKCLDFWSQVCPLYGLWILLLLFGVTWYKLMYFLLESPSKISQENLHPLSPGLTRSSSSATPQTACFLTLIMLVPFPQTCSLSKALFQKHYSQLNTSEAGRYSKRSQLPVRECC